LSIRYRSGGWPGRKMVVTIPDPIDQSSTKEVVLFERDASVFQKYLYNFCFGGSFFPKGCLVCKDQTAESADISLGDAWLPRITSTDSSGTNIIILRTTQAQKVIGAAANESVLDLEEAQSEDILNSQGGLVGKKLGLLGRHLKNNSMSASELSKCERYIPQYIPEKIVLVQKRISRWLAESLPNALAFSCFASLKLLLSICIKFIKIIRNTF
jgi:hypothetical protein